MNVTLAGYNVDSQIIDELKKRAEWTEDNVTPETLSAAYARISRDPADIGDLRKRSREETAKARKSNEIIIFGLGHASVAEHAVFNFDIVGIARFAVEEIQKYRLASFTEKSQRYITLDGDHYIPKVIVGTPFEKKFRELITFQNEVYFSLYKTLQADLYHKHGDMITTKGGKITVDGWAKEDARYVVSLSTMSQFGMTVNARTLEHMLRRFRASELEEVRDLGEKMFSAVHPLSPSIVKYTQPTKYDTERSSSVKSLVSQYGLESKVHETECRLIDITDDPDTKLCAALLFDYGTSDYISCLEKAEKMSDKDKKDLVYASLCHRECYDRVERAFESVEMTFELVISSSNYAQLKRHRMSTQLVQDYDPDLGVTVPPSIREIVNTDCFAQAMEKSRKLYNELNAEFPQYRNYALTNAHRRRVLLKLNARELYHFMSLRSDEHAQWDIRKTSDTMKELVTEKAPLLSVMLSGKSDFDECKKKVFPC